MFLFHVFSAHIDPFTFTISVPPAPCPMLKQISVNLAK